MSLPPVDRNVLCSASDVGRVWFLLDRKRRGHADEDSICLSERRRVRRRRQPVCGQARLQFACRDIPEVAATGLQRLHLLAVNVEADHGVAAADQIQCQRQPHVSKAHDRHGRGPRRNLAFEISGYRIDDHVNGPRRSPRPCGARDDRGSSLRGAKRRSNLARFEGRSPVAISTLEEIASLRSR